MFTTRAEKWEAKVLKGVLVNITPRGGHTMINYQNKIYFFGGAKKDDHLNDVFEVELESITEAAGTIVAKVIPISTFPNLYEFTSIVHGHKLWIFGGADKQESKNDVYAFNIEALENECEKIQTENAPVPRTQYGNKSLIEIDGSSNLVVFGGGNKFDRPVDDKSLYLFNLETTTWTKVRTMGNSPSPRQGHVSVSIGQTVFIHGGLCMDGFKDDIFYLNLSSTSEKKWIEISCQTKPCARAAHNVAAIGDSFYIFGGFDSKGKALNDLWKFDTKTSTWTQIQYSGEVSPRLDFAMCCFTIEGKTNLLIHGGFNSESVFYDDLVQLTLVQDPVGGEIC